MTNKPVLRVEGLKVSFSTRSSSGHTKCVARAVDGVDFYVNASETLAWMFAVRIAVVYLGRIIEEGSSEELIAAPLHPYTKALVSVIPIPETSENLNRTVLTGEIPNPSAIPSGCRFRPRCPLFIELGEPDQCRTDDSALHGEVGHGSHRVVCHFVQTRKTNAGGENI